MHVCVSIVTIPLRGHKMWLIKVIVDAKFCVYTYAIYIYFMTQILMFYLQVYYMYYCIVT